jgi:hypothetical protein
MNIIGFIAQIAMILSYAREGLKSFNEPVVVPVLKMFATIRTKTGRL